MASAPVNKIERAHQMYREGSYSEALGFYTEALSMAKTKPQKIALHSNRAACFLKLHDFKKSLAPIPESEAELEEEEEDEEDEAEPNRYAEKVEQYEEKEDAVFSSAGKEQIPEVNETTAVADVIPPKTPVNREVSPQGRDPKVNYIKTISPAEVVAARAVKVSSEKEKEKEKENGWQAIPKPKGHSSLDYARWDRVEDDSSEEDDEDDDDEDSQPQFRFRVRTVGVRPVK